jgi:hypothetical protein
VKITIKAKKAFANFAQRHHSKVKHYHCDNGIFAGTKFRAAVEEEVNQMITFCGAVVNAAHSQNRVTKRRIQDSLIKHV